MVACVASLSAKAASGVCGVNVELFGLIARRQLLLLERIRSRSVSHLRLLTHLSIRQGKARCRIKSLLTKACRQIANVALLIGLKVGLLNTKARPTKRTSRSTLGLCAGKLAIRFKLSIAHGVLRHLLFKRVLILGQVSQQGLCRRIGHATNIIGTK